MPSELHVVFTNFPGPENECVFVEVEDAQGKSLDLGEWRRRADGYVELVFTSLPEAKPRTLMDTVGLKAHPSVWPD
jgi:hypothetical protein